MTHLLETPDNPDHWITAALAHHRAGRLAAAGTCYRRALAAAPEHPTLLHLFGVWHAQTGDARRAAALIRRSVVQRPDDPARRIDLAKALLLGGRLDAATDRLHEALALAPALAAGHLALAKTVRAAEQPQAARPAARRAVQLAPGDPEARVLLAELDDHDHHARAAIALAPAAAAGHLAFATRLARARRAIAAAGPAARAVRLAPTDPGAQLNRGHIERAAGQFDSAADAYRRAIAAEPTNAAAHGGLGHLAAQSGDAAGAEALFARARILAPTDAGLRWNQGLARLRAGDWPRGWHGFEARLARSEIAAAVRALARPPWDGRPIDGGTLLIHAEQGYGDTLQFLRFLPAAAAAAGPGGRLVLEVQPALVPLARTVALADRVIGQGDPRPPFDRHCPLLSLPARLGLTLADLPAAVPYLAVAPDRLARWRDRLGAPPPDRPVTVALAWAGNPAFTDDALRSPGLGPLEPLLACPGVRWLAIQVGAARAGWAAAVDAAGVPPGAAIDLGEALDDFADTAAVMAVADLVITPCTAPAHLAGALGRPLWVLLSAAADWRWFDHRADSPWYPTAWLIRQRRPGDWHAVVDAVAAALTARVDAWDGTPHLSGDTGVSQPAATKHDLNKEQSPTG